MIPDEEGFICEPLIFTFLPDQQDERGDTMKLIDLNSRVHDACTNVVRRMETADLARPAGLTSAASLAYRLLFNGLISEHGYGPDDPVEWATRSTRAVITIQELASEYRMLAETSEEYDTRNVLQDVTVALNTLANEIEYPHMKSEPESEPKLEPGVLKCATHSALIDWSSDIKEAYERAVADVKACADIIADKRSGQHLQTYINLLSEACACKDFIHASLDERTQQAIEACVTTMGVFGEIRDMWLNTHDPSEEDLLGDARIRLVKLADTIGKTMWGSYIGR
nr:MAG TPA: hypothetical protein [Caudoviricetes sp.]